MVKPYNVNTNFQGVNGFGAPFCDLIYSARLAATTDTTLTVPSVSAPGLGPRAYSSNRFLAVFQYTSDTNKDIFVAVNTTAAAPAGATFAASNSELHPPAKVVKAGDILHFFATTANTDVTVCFYAIQE